MDRSSKDRAACITAQDERFRIGAGEPPTFRMAYQLAYNQAVDALGRDITEKFVISVGRLADSCPPIHRLNIVEGAGRLEVEPEVIKRRRDAKRFNEGSKLGATFLNNLAVGCIIAGLLSPAVAQREMPTGEFVGLALTSVVLHILAQMLLRFFLKSED